MPLDGNVMGTAVAAAVKAVAASIPPTGAVSDAQLENIWKAACTEIVAHIKSFAVIPPGIAVATTGSPSAQTGATTAPGTIT